MASPGMYSMKTSAFTTKESRLRLDFGSNSDRFVPTAVIASCWVSALNHDTATSAFAPRRGHLVYACWNSKDEESKSWKRI
jgi:hypothetical protein